MRHLDDGCSARTHAIRRQESRLLQEGVQERALPGAGVAEHDHRERIVRQLSRQRETNGKRLLRGGGSCGTGPGHGLLSGESKQLQRSAQLLCLLLRTTGLVAAIRRRPSEVVRDGTTKGHDLILAAAVVIQAGIGQRQQHFHEALPTNARPPDERAVEKVSTSVLTPLR